MPMLCALPHMDTHTHSRAHYGCSGHCLAPSLLSLCPPRRYLSCRITGICILTVGVTGVSVSSAQKVQYAHGHASSAPPEAGHFSHLQGIATDGPFAELG